MGRPLLLRWKVDVKHKPEKWIFLKISSFSSLSRQTDIGMSVPEVSLYCMKPCAGIPVDLFTFSIYMARITVFPRCLISPDFPCSSPLPQRLCSLFLGLFFGNGSLSIGSFVSWWTHYKTLFNLLLSVVGRLLFMWFIAVTILFP